MNGSKEIQVERKGRAVLIWLNRPEAKNKLHRGMIDTMTAAVRELDRDPGTGAIVLAARGEVFCAGGDMGDYTAMSVGEIRAYWEAFIDLYTAIAETTKPVLAAVDGAVEGGGFTLFDACDLAIATPRAVFSAPEAKAGLGPIVVAVAVGRSLGRRKAMEMFFTGAEIEAALAERLGLVNKIVPEGQAVEAALAMAASMAENNPSAIGLCKRLYRACYDRDYRDNLQRALDVLISMLKSEDGLETARARHEKRVPRWTGR